jgi:hypothetical protein
MWLWPILGVLGVGSLAIWQLGNLAVVCHNHVCKHTKNGGIANIMFKHACTNVYTSLRKRAQAHTHTYAHIHTPIFELH